MRCHGLQCGVCTPGMLMTARALLDRDPDPSEQTIREAISGQICRCTGYTTIVRSVQWAAAHPGSGSLIAVNSGANLNFDRLRHVAERAEIGEGAEALLAVAMKDDRDDYRRFLDSLDGRSVTEFNYRWSGDGQA